MWLALLACSEPDDSGGALHAGAGEDRPYLPKDSGEDAAGLDSGDDGAGDSAEAGPCPTNMALVGDGLCIDQYEGTLVGWSPYDVPESGVAQSVGGVSPQGYISGDVAQAACDAAGKRLCTTDEWMAACAGVQGRTYPYGKTYDLYACNDTYGGSHPVIDYFGSSDVWDMEHMNDPGINQQVGTISLTGEFTDCVTPERVFDMHGNLHEWVSDANGTFKGGFYADAVINGAGCNYTTTAHEMSYHDYSTGFRCCQGVD